MSTLANILDGLKTSFGLVALGLAPAVHALRPDAMAMYAEPKAVRMIPALAALALTRRAPMVLARVRAATQARMAAVEWARRLAALAFALPTLAEAVLS